MREETYRLESKEFIQGDCIEIMKERELNPHLIITDPPYNIGWKYSDKVVFK